MNKIDKKNAPLNLLFKKIYSKKVFIISGKNSFYKSGAKDIFLKKINKDNSVFYFKKTKNPEINELIKISKKILKFKPEIILGIGGGAVIDYVKLASTRYKIVYNKKNPIVEVEKKIAKTIIVPTTSGSGAESTKFSVLYIKNKKFSIESEMLKPDKFYFVPSFNLKNNMYQRACSGLDAFCQSVEAIFSRKSNKLSLLYAEKSISLFLKNFKNFMIKPNERNSLNMLISANYSGRAINIAKTNVPHALSYYLASKLQIGHGHSVYINLQQFLLFLYVRGYSSNNEVKRKIDLLMKYMRCKNINELMKKLIEIKKVSKLKFNFQINKQIEKIVKKTDPKRLGNCPIEINATDLKNILLKKF